MRRPRKRICQILPVRPVGFQRKTSIGFGVTRNLNQHAIKTFPRSFRLFRLSALSAGPVDLVDGCFVGDDAALNPARGLQPHTILLRDLDHRRAEGVVVELVICPKIEHLARLRVAVQHDMGMWMRPVLMNSSDEVELARSVLEKPLTHVLGDARHVLTTGPDRECHQKMGRVTHLRVKMLGPTAGEKVGSLLDLSRCQRFLPSMNAATVEKMARLRREVLKLGTKLDPVMAAPLLDGLEDRRGMTKCRTDHLALAPHRPPCPAHPAPAALEKLAGYCCGSISPCHARVPSVPG